RQLFGSELQEVFIVRPRREREMTISGAFRLDSQPGIKGFLCGIDANRIERDAELICSSRPAEQRPRNAAIISAAHAGIDAHPLVSLCERIRLLCVMAG